MVSHMGDSPSLVGQGMNWFTASPGKIRMATLILVNWLYYQQLLEPVGYISLAEAERNYQQLTESAKEA